jgi:hypothetical protein
MAGMEVYLVNLAGSFPISLPALSEVLMPSTRLLLRSNWLVRHGVYLMAMAAVRVEMFTQTPSSLVSHLDTQITLPTTYTGTGPVTATSQAVEAATSVSSQFVSDTQNDGLVGLSFSSINTVTPKPATTFFDTVKGSLAQALFAADLKKGQAGSYDFGVSYFATLVANLNTDDLAVHRQFQVYWGSCIRCSRQQPGLLDVHR